MPAKTLQTHDLTTVGSLGLNTQSPASALGPEWLTEADNIVYGLEGRIASRKGRKQISRTVASSVKSLGEYIKSDGSTEYYGGSGSTIVKLDTTATPDKLTTQAFSGTPQTITDSNWQFENFNRELWATQSGHTPINFDGTNWYDITDLGSYVAPAGVTTFDPNGCLGAFSRMWYIGVTEAPDVAYYSATLIGEDLNAASAGKVDLKTVWGNDVLVGVEALEDKIIFFGKDNIVIYRGADDPTTMVLDELIKGTGLAGRDNTFHVNTDLLFMSYEGLRSLKRTTESDGKSPVDDLSISVRDDLARLLSTEDLDTVKSVYYQEDGHIFTFFPGNNSAYCFDMTNVRTSGLPRITTFTFESGPLCGVSTLDGKLYLGLSDSVGEYTGYYDVSLANSTGTYGTEGACSTAGGTWDSSDNTCWSTTNTSYNYTWTTAWLDLGSPSISKILKNAYMTYTGGRSTATTLNLYRDYKNSNAYTKTFSITGGGSISLWGSSGSLYGTSKYSSTLGPVEYKVPLGRTGKVIQLRVTTEVAGFYSSLVDTNLTTKQGKIR